MAADAEIGRMKQARITLSVTPGNVTKVTLADNVRGVRIRPQGVLGNQVIYAVNEDPAAEGAGVFAVGNFAVVGEAADVRIPGYASSVDGSGVPRDIRFRSTVASIEILMETF